MGRDEGAAKSKEKSHPILRDPEIERLPTAFLVLTLALIQKEKREWLFLSLLSLPSLNASVGFHSLTSEETKARVIHGFVQG